MAIDYARLGGRAAAIIAKFGATGQWTDVRRGEYDPDTGTSPDNSVTTDVTAAVFDYDSHNIDGTRILTGDKQVLLSGDVAGKPDDIFTWQGTAYRVISVKPLAPAGVNVITEWQVRR